MAISTGAAGALDDPAGAAPAATDTALSSASAGASATETTGSSPAGTTPASAASTTAASPAPSSDSATSDAATTSGSTTASDPPSGATTSGATTTSTSASPTVSTPTADPVDPAAPDTTAPAVLPAVVGTLGGNGWYVSDVQLTWAVADPESAISDDAGCGPVAVAADAAGLQVTCTATSAGGAASATVVINRDTTAPAITCPTGAQRVQGSSATLEAAVADAGSGPAAAAVSAAVDTTTLGPVTLALSAADLAGNIATATCSAEIIPDTSAPVIAEPVVSGPMGQNGWYVGDVAVSFGVSDPDSAIQSTTGCGIPSAEIVAADSAGAVVTCTAISSGGPSTRSVTVPRDATGPLIACPTAPSIVQGSARSLTAAVSDAVSGSSVASVARPLPSTVLGAWSISLSAADLAGNRSTVDCQYLVVPDATPPVVAASIQGPLGVSSRGAGPVPSAGGSPWYIGPVTVSFNVTEDESAMLGESGCGTTVIDTDTAGQVVTCSATSYGATTTRSVVVALDRTPPVVSCSGVPAYIQGSTGIVSATFSDATSGPTAIGATVNVDTTSLGLNSIAIGASDAAGNPGSQTCTYRVLPDESKPIITPRIEGTSLAQGWYTGPVVVSFVVDDPDSPVLSTEGCETVTVGADAVSQVAAVCRATSYGGTAVQPITVSRDSVAPVITCLDLRFVQGTAGKATANATDATSGVVSASVTEQADTSRPGTRAVVLSSTDRAGNTATQRCTYDVVERKTVAAAKLSSTGSNLFPIVLGGIVLALGGTLLAVIARRRAHAHSRHRL